jgi:hypothetical protein
MRHIVVTYLDEQIDGLFQKVTRSSKDRIGYRYHIKLASLGPLLKSICRFSDLSGTFQLFEAIRPESLY